MNYRQKIINTGRTVMFLFAVLLFVFSVFFKNEGEAYTGTFTDSTVFDRGWTCTGVSPGETRSVTLPARVPAVKGETLVLHNILPEDIGTGMSMSCRSSRQDIEVRIDGKVRASYLRDGFDIFVGNPPSAYVFTDLYSEDASKPIDIYITPYGSGTTVIDAPEYAYGHDIWLRLIRSNILMVFESAALILIGIIIIAAFSVLHRKIDVGYSFYYLAQLIIVFSLWELSESKLRQLMFSAPYFSAVFAFVFVELIAAYVILFMDELQGHYYKRMYAVIETLVFVQLFINTVLNFTGAVYYYNTLVFSHIWTAAAIGAVLVTLVLDIKSGRIKRYSTAAVGIAGVAACAIFELVYFYVSNRNLLSIPTGIGLLMLVGANLVQTIEDIITLKQKNDLNEEAVHIANEANKAKSEFLALVSHEIRTPLNAVIGMNEMILRESDQENVLEYAESASSAGKALLGIINNILDISKIEAGKLEIIDEEYEIYSLAADCYNMTSDRAENKGLALKFSVDETMPSRLYGDMFHIRQIAVNFITNAIKYTDKGTVDVSFSGQETEEGFSLCISVRDTGIGLTDESKEKLFTSFQRFDMKRNRSVEGTGLGLAICKKLTELMNGTLTVESEYGKGSKFGITVPQKVTDKTPVGHVSGFHPAHRKQQQSRRFTAAGARVLVVDDVDMNLKVFRSLLKGYGLVIDTALSGKQCLEMAGSQPYDIIFMDHMMPEMDGMETFGKMKETGEGPNAETPVIMLTANAISGMKEKYLAAGFSGYLSKPIDNDKLNRVLLEFLPKEKIFYSTGTDDGVKNVREVSEGRFDCLRAAFPDVDIERGVAYCSGSEDFYIELLKDLAADTKRTELQTAFDGRDWEMYAVKIHAVKGAARTLGLADMGVAAEGLQAAAESGDSAYIEKNHDKVMEMFDALTVCAKHMQ